MSDVGDAFIQINVDTEAADAKISETETRLNEFAVKAEAPKTLNVNTAPANASIDATQAKLNAITAPKEGSVTVNTSSAVTNLEELKAIEAEVAIPVEGSVILDTAGPVASVEALSEVLTITTADIGALTTELTPVESGFAAAAAAAQEMTAQLDATEVASANLLVDLIALVAAAEDAALAIGSTTSGVAGLEAALAAVPAEAEAAAVGLEAAGAGAAEAGGGFLAALGPAGLLVGAFGFLESVLSRSVTRIAVKETVKEITAIPSAFDAATASLEKFKDSTNGVGKALTDLNTQIVSGLSNKTVFVNDLVDMGLAVKDVADVLNNFGANAPPSFDQLKGAAEKGLNSIRDGLNLTGDAAAKFQLLYFNALNPASDTQAFTGPVSNLGTDVSKRYSDLIRLTGLTKEQIDSATTSIRVLNDTANAVDLDSLERSTIKASVASGDAAKAVLTHAEAYTGLDLATAKAGDLTKLYIEYQYEMTHALGGTGDALDNVSQRLIATGNVGISQSIILNDGLRKNMDSLTQFDNSLQARQGIDSLTLAPLAIPDFGALKAAFDGLDTPVMVVNADLANLKSRLDGLQNPTLDLDKAVAAVTTLGDSFKNVGKGIDATTTVGAKNVGLLTDVITTSQAAAAAAFVKSGGDTAAANDAYTSSIARLEAKYVAAHGSAADFDQFLTDATATPKEYSLVLSAATFDTIKAEIASLPSPDLQATIVPVVDPASATTAQTQLDALKGIGPNIVKYTPQTDPEGYRATDQQLVLLALSRDIALHPANAPEDISKAKNDLDTIANAQYPATITVHPDLTLGNTADDIQKVADANYKAVISADGDTADAQAKFRQIENTAYSAKISADAGGVPGSVQAAINSRTYSATVTVNTITSRIGAAGAHWQAFDKGGMTDIANTPSHYITPQQANLGPHFMYGEPSTRGEYFLSMDPQYKERNVGLWKQAGSELGVYAAAHSTPTGGHPDPASIAMLARVAAKMDKMIAAAAAMPPITINTPITDPENHAAKVHWSQRARLKSAGVL